MKVTKKDLLLLGIVFLVLLAADQITKAIAFAVMGENAPVTMVIPGFLGFNTVLNEGISFSIGEGDEWTQPIVIAITAVASIVIAVLICKIPKRRLLLRYALVLILAGAVGNLIDRIAMQAVRDFIYMDLGFIKPFSNNVADLEITVGAVMLIICLLFVDEEAIFRPAPKESPAQEMKGEEPPAGGLKEEELPAEGGEVYGQGEAAAGTKTQPAENSSSKTGEEPTENASSQTEEKFAEDVSSETEEEPASAEAASSGEGADGACGKEAASSAADTKEGKGEPEAPQAGHGNA